MYWETEQIVTPNKQTSNNKRCHNDRVWWNDYLTILWNDYCEAENIYSKSTGTCKQRHNKAIMKLRESEFDREVQRAKRSFWRRKQQSMLFLRELLDNDHNNKHLYTVQVGHVCVAENEDIVIPIDVRIYKNYSFGRSCVLNRWVLDYHLLFDSTERMEQDKEVYSNISDELITGSIDSLSGCTGSCHKGAKDNIPDLTSNVSSGTSSTMTYKGLDCPSEMFETCSTEFEVYVTMLCFRNEECFCLMYIIMVWTWL